jgi:hypothetical protein
LTGELLIGFACRIGGASESCGFTVPHVEMHGHATDGARRMIRMGFSLVAKSELPAAEQTQEPLVTGVSLSIAIERFGTAPRTSQVPEHPRPQRNERVNRLLQPAKGKDCTLKI